MTNNNEAIITGLKLIGWQNDFAKIFKNLEPDDKLFVKASRQKGKSTLLLQTILFVGINRPKSTSFYISPTNNQNRSRFKDIINILGGSPLVTKLNESTQEIRFWNGSSVSFLSAESGENLRGNTCSRGGILIIDEAAFIKDDTITSILTPYTTVHHANTILVSTPRRKSGYFFEGYNDAVNSVPGYRYIDVNNYDNSFFISEEQIADYKRRYSPEKFKNEVLGLFSDNSEGLFGDYQKIFLEPKDKDAVYAGIDFSTTGTDYTVISMFNKDKQMCGLWYNRTIKDPVERINKIIGIINSNSSLKVVLCETNSIGSVYISLLKKGLRNPNIIKEFTTTNTSKKEIIENLIKNISCEEITLLRDDLLDYQFSIFESKPLSKGNYTYEANPKVTESHDDIVMATAICISGFTHTIGNYLVRGKHF